MHTTSRIIAAILFITVNSNAQTDSATFRKIADEVLINGKAYDDLHELCKTIGARLSGSPEAEKAVKWGVAALKKAGADTVYLQKCMVPHWVRGKKETAAILLPGSKTETPLSICALGGSVGTPEKGLEAEVVEVKNFEELEKLGKDKIQGKIVFYNYPFDQRFVFTFGGYGDAVRYRGRGPSEAAKYGAIASLCRSVGTLQDDNPHTGATRYKEGIEKIPAGAISNKGAETLSNALKTTPHLKLHIRMNCETLPDVESYNVVAELRGTEHKEEIITVGGHLDSWDLAEGAHDDGTGCAQAIEVIRTLKALHLQTKRTVRAVLFMNEENGLRGGAKYAELAKQNNEKHIAALESDAGGFSPRGFSLDVTPEQKAKIVAYKPLFYRYGVYDFDRNGGGADVDGLKELGAAVMELSPDSQRYFDVHHAATDVFENVNKRELELGASVMTMMIYVLSQYGL